MVVNGKLGCVVIVVFPPARLYVGGRWLPMLYIGRLLPRLYGGVRWLAMLYLTLNSTFRERAELAVNS